jgi:prophage DNA circulation protein
MRGSTRHSWRFKSLRAAVPPISRRARADLASVVTVAVPASLASLVVAKRLYRDSSREGEIVVEAEPVHPAFMPATFAVLAI